jgi:uncharacterized protein (DUF1697 family)
MYDSNLGSCTRLTQQLYMAIAKRFGFNVAALLRDLKSMRTLVKAIPSRWTDDKAMRCYVMFLWADVARPSVLKQLQPKSELDDVLYASGAIVWRVDRKDITRSGMSKPMGTALYKRMTIRNVNTTRKLLELMEAS